MQPSLQPSVIENSSLQAIYSLELAHQIQGKKILQLVPDKSGMKLRSVVHNNIRWTWWASFLAWLGIGPYNLGRIVSFIKNFDLAELSRQERDHISAIMNHRIRSYNAKRWLYTLDPLDLRTRVEKIREKMIK